MMLKQFFDFLKHYGVVGLAIAVMIGGKVNDFVGTLVKDLIMPLIFQPILKTLSVQDISTLEFHGIFYGRVIASFLDFFIVALVVFLFAKIVLKEEVVAKK